MASRHQDGRSGFPNYGYGELRTPILEEAQLFVRGVGETTDIVEKEMYLFQDRDKKMVCLRPENTAGVVRAMMQHGKIRPDMEEKIIILAPCFVENARKRAVTVSFTNSG